MRTPAHEYRDVCHKVADGFRFPIREVLGTFGLADFINESLDDDHTCHEVAEEAIVFLCDGHSKQERVFQFGVLSVCHFLHQHHAQLAGTPTPQVLSDLISILAAGCNRTAIQGWIQSN